MPTITENEAYACAFTRQGWSMDDWMFVRRSDMESLDEWVQQEKHIENKGVSSHSFTSMVYRKPWRGDFTVTAGMAFMERMAPSIVLAWRFEDDTQNQRFYREHVEIVLWDEGINAWLHTTRNDKPVWTKSAYCKFPIQSNMRHELQVCRKGQELAITVGDRTFGYRQNELPDELYIGITAAEGINRLYDFDLR